jgi:putative ABC transport system permease protein
MDLGIDTSPLLTMQLTLPARKYPSVENRAAFLQRIDERLQTVSTIEGATTSSNFPLGGGAPRQFAIEGRTLQGDRPPNVTMVSVGPRYFDTIGARLMRGRALNDSDGRPLQTAVVNRRLVDMYFPQEDPIGKRIRLTEEFPTAPQTGWFTVVGVAPTVRQSNFEDVNPDPVVYVTHVESPTLGRGLFLIVRTHGDSGKATSVLRNEIRALDPDLPLFNIRTMDQQLAMQRWPFRVFGTMFAVFAAIAMVLAAVGVYAVTAYSVSQRTQEIGVRMALGAQSRAVRWLILRRGLVQLSIGLFLGLAGALGVGRLLRSLLVQTGTADPVTLTSIAVLLIGVVVLACLWPARRATRLDPVVALRYE